MKIDRSAVKSVYSGINGKCCCGCSCKHTYASVHVIEAGWSRGYPVQADEVNDKTVNLICNTVEKLPIEQTNDVCISAVCGKRLYIVYWRD